MQTLELATLTPKIQSVLVLGMEGAGKTHFIGTFPKPILLYSLDGGYQTLAGVSGVRAKVFTEVDRRKPVAAAEFEVEFAKYLAGQEPLYKWPDGKEEPFKTIAIDPLSFLSQYMMHNIQFVNRTTDKKPSWDEYDIVLKKWTDLLIRCLRVSAEQGAHVVCTCHVKIDKDEDTGQMWFLPDIAGSAREKLGAWFDAVFYLKVDKKPTGEKEYQLCTVGERRERARLRLPSAIEGTLKAIEVPDFAVISGRLEAAFKQQGGK